MTALSANLPELAAMATLAPILAQAFVSLACDIALVLDPHGVITYAAHSEAGGLIPAGAVWVGRLWTETVTRETQPKIEGLLAEVAASGRAAHREVTLAASCGGTIPVDYAALRLGPEGPTLAVGRDLRAAASLQERFLDAQRELERGYQRALGAVGSAPGKLPRSGAPGLTARAMANLLPAAAELLGIDPQDRRQGAPDRRPTAPAPAGREAPAGARAGQRRQPRRSRRQR
jgi:hypothetical protein